MLRKRLLIIGCGDVMQRALPWLRQRFKVFALARSVASADHLRALGVYPVIGDLDDLASLSRIANIADYVIHAAPPHNAGETDSRTLHLLAALRRGRILSRRLVYISTSGVYGDCEGEWVSEVTPCSAFSSRAIRRISAEKQLRKAGLGGMSVSILRAPGIYAEDRLPTERIARGTPLIRDEEDSYTNHIHAADLAKTCALAVFRGKRNRVYNVSDHVSWKMGFWFDQIAAAYDLPRLPRLPKAQVESLVPPSLWSFMRESRRLRNDRLIRELRVTLTYPTPQHVLQAIASRHRG